MKKQTNYAWLAVLIVLILAAIPSVLPSILDTNNEKQISKDGIVQASADDRGLTSVVYVQDGQKWALDYLDPKQLDSIKKLFITPCLCIPGYRPPCPVSEPLGDESISADRMCGCPVVKNGKCEHHQPTVPKKPGE